MKKKRQIQIKNPALRKIRNNLRNLIIAACSKQLSEITLKSEQLIGRGEHQLEWELNDSWWRIERSLRASICKCPSCFRSDRDMIYNPKSKEWYCLKCYRENQKYEPSKFL